MKRSLAALLLLVVSTASADVLRARIKGPIHPITEEFVGRAIDTAEREKDQALVIELRTPGGLEDSTRTIVEKMLKSTVPVIVYVSPSGSRAASAGFIIL